MVHSLCKSLCVKSAVLTSTNTKNFLKGRYAQALRATYVQPRATAAAWAGGKGVRSKGVQALPQVINVDSATHLGQLVGALVSIASYRR